ncbi:uncharacterized protein G2W53_022133 [Senna tora]|uniref:Uncharacterized protein n=1 Tax=Senna tora TaxID=362788 RepID=A0A834TMH6_9FABA|nr:uncharacterized protein G2W53_022133 [Senna tora]
MKEDGNGGLRRNFLILKRARQTSSKHFPFLRSASFSPHMELLFRLDKEQSPKPQVKTSCKSTAPTVSPPDDNREILKKILSTNEKLLSKMEQTYLLLMYQSDPRRIIGITMPRIDELD